jgi:DNA-binding transcriptional LysR family regulator
MQSCERIMLQGQAQFLLCHHHPAAATSLDPADFCSVLLGHDTLVPVVAPGPEGAPRFPLPGTPGEPVPHLAYSQESGMGRILAAARAAAGPRVWLEPVFTSHVASVLESMALAGQGMAWLPMSLAADPLGTGALVRAGVPHWDIPMEIRLYRPRQHQAPGAERFWALL